MTNTAELKKDPYNLIITGVGGQGNVLASRMIGNMLSAKGFQVTIGETFGASQRGGSVMSHLRISSRSVYSPQIAKGKADMIVAMEPTEAIRVMASYGNPEVAVLCNTRPVQSVGVIAGEINYPSLGEIRQMVNDLSASAWFVNATDAALEEMGNPIFGNIMLLGALAATGELPLPRDEFESVIARDMSPDKVEINLKAYDMGMEMITGAA